jgi:hypothetical protein
MVLPVKLRVVALGGEVRQFPTEAPDNVTVLVDLVDRLAVARGDEIVAFQVLKTRYN